MKALTVQQPWADAILHGGKNIENRTRVMNYRGPLLIHAGLTYDRFAFGPDEMLLRNEDAPRGFIVGVVDVVMCCRASLDDVDAVCACGPWAQAGSAHWRLESPRAFVTPVPCSGRLGLWDFDLDLAVTP